MYLCFLRQLDLIRFCNSTTELVQTEGSLSYSRVIIDTTLASLAGSTRLFNRELSLAQNGIWQHCVRFSLQHLSFMDNLQWIQSLLRETHAMLQFLLRLKPCIVSRQGTTLALRWWHNDSTKQPEPWWPTRCARL